MKINSIKTDFRVPPQAPDAEESILSSCLLGFAGEACEMLSSADFYRGVHQIIFSAIETLTRAGDPVDLPSIVEHLRTAGTLERAGGAAYIARMTDSIPQAPNLEHYCNLVKRAHTRRQVIARAQEIITMGFDEPDFDTLINAAEKAFVDIDPGQDGDNLTSYRQLAETMPERWEALGQSMGVTGVPSGFASIDQVTGGCQPSDLIVIAARPGMGKTVLGLNIAEGAAVAGVPVLFFSLEMSAEQLYSRQTSKTAWIDGQKLRLGGIQPQEWERIVDAQGRLYGLPIYIDDSPRLHFMEICRRSRKAARDHGIKLVVIDYLQLIRGDNSQRKDLEIGDITGAMKGLAKELNIPVILLSQLNRGVESRDNKRPRLSDLRESGAIEQDADIVMFIYRDEYYHPEITDQPGIAEIDFAKHRNGPTGVVKLHWIGWRSTFEDC